MRASAWLAYTRRRQVAVGIGLAALVSCVVLGIAAPGAALRSYLAAYVFWLGLSLGSLTLLLVHALTGGAWGYAIRPVLLAAARVLPLLALLLLPVLFGVHALYPWAQSELLATNAQMRAQTWYLDVPFFAARAVAYFVLWTGLVIGLGRRLGDPARTTGLAGFAAPGLIVLGLTVTLAAVDWIMSLVPQWHSSVFGLTVATGQILAAGALALLCVIVGARRFPPRLLHDLGNLLLMLVLAWSYLAFMEYLTVWTGDLPAETVWYIPRTLTSWKWLAWFLVVFHFAIPFTVLLSRRAKRHRVWLGGIAAALLVANLADAFWLVVPSFRSRGFAVAWTDPLAIIGIGCLWSVAFLGQLRVVRRCAVIDADALEVAQHG